MAQEAPLYTQRLGVPDAPGASVQGNATPATNNASAQSPRRRNRTDGPQSQVWIKAK